MADEYNLLVLEDSVVENPLSCEENSIYYDVEIFIQEIQKLECLWNTSDFPCLIQRQKLQGECVATAE